MQKKIKIGITYTGSDEKHANYLNWLMGEAVELVTLSAENNNGKEVKKLGGIVLSGGIDMHPKYYGSTEFNYPNAPATFHQARDEFEIAVFDQTMKTGMPVLAVCRGMQLVNCVMGGNLTQDIGTDANTIHRFVYNDKAHGVNIVPATLLNDIVKTNRTVANSAHHQCINNLGSGLKINCTSDDGIIEGVEWEDKKGKPVFLGIQWHPERMYKFGLQDSLLAKNIKDWFMEEVKK